METPQSEVTPRPKSKSKAARVGRKRRRAAFEGPWQEHGMIRQPAHADEFHLAVAARNTIDALPCAREVRGMLAMGAPQRDILTVIQAGGRRLPKSVETMKRYLGTYVQFYIPPEERIAAVALPMVQHTVGPDASGRPGWAQDLMRGNGEPVRRKLADLVRGISEIEDMDELRRIQMARVRRFFEFEDRLDGLPMPGLKAEIDLAKDLFQASVEKKQSLGLLYRAPKTFDVRNLTPTAETRVLSAAPEEDRAAAVAFFERLEAMLGDKPGEVIDVEASNGRAG